MKFGFGLLVSLGLLVGCAPVSKTVLPTTQAEVKDSTTGDDAESSNDSAAAKKVVYLTIDDGPTADMAAKLELLNELDIKAIWFCLGTGLVEHPEPAVEALKSGHVLASHGWDHSRFSELTLDQCYEQIDRTDEQLQEIYKRAGIVWKRKYFRFPYGDKGAGGFGDDSWRTGRPEFRAAIQQHLKKRGYVQPSFEGLDKHPFYRDWGMGRDIDVDYTFDCGEWRVPDNHSGDPRKGLMDVVTHMDGTVIFQEMQSLNVLGCSEIVVVHDHDATARLFPHVIIALVVKNLDFKLPK